MKVHEKYEQRVQNYSWFENRIQQLFNLFKDMHM